jgi:hypothetical protein
MIKEMRATRVFMEEEDASMVAWTFNMQECGLSITL